MENNNSNNKSNNKLLIIVIAILVIIVMALMGYIIMNKDFKENDKKPETKQEEKEQEEKEREIKDIDVIKNISTKIDLLVAKDKESVEYEASKNLIGYNFRFGFLKNELTSEDKQKIVMESLEWEKITGDAWKDNQEMSTYINNYLEILPEASVFEDNEQITAEKANQKSVELFGKEITNPVSIIEKCSKYIYDATSKLYFRPYTACGGSSGGTISSYKSKFTKKGNVAYAYVSFAFVIPSGNEEYKAYKDFDIDGERINYKNEYQTSRPVSPEYFKLDSTNYQDFSEYKFTFKKGDNGNYYFVDVEQVK